MSKLREKIQQALATVPNFGSLKDNVEITITSDGLRIELLETEAGMFFESGRANPTDAGASLLARMAEELGKLPNSLLVEGHTDAKAFAASASYSNWELSTDRANAARRLMEAHGVGPEQVAQVRGFAERQLRHPEAPDAASNRRISVIVQYLPTSAPPSADSGQPDAKSKPEAGKGGEAEHKTKPKPRRRRRLSPRRSRIRQRNSSRYMYSGTGIPSIPAIRSSCRRKKSVIHRRNTFFSRFSSWMIGYFS